MSEMGNLQTMMAEAQDAITNDPSRVSLCVPLEFVDVFSMRWHHRNWIVRAVLLNLAAAANMDDELEREMVAAIDIRQSRNDRPTRLKCKDIESRIVGKYGTNTVISFCMAEPMKSKARTGKHEAWIEWADDDGLLAFHVKTI